ncbi:uncharacterized protein LY89DRAFT_550845, partial [Mollisia scopiformis]
MCYYDQYQMTCGDWKWGNFRKQCSKEYRTGDTCGMKLIMEAYQLDEMCKYCKKVEIKSAKIRKEQDRIKRWCNEGNRRASIEAAEENIAAIEREIMDLMDQTSR